MNKTHEPLRIKRSGFLRGIASSSAKGYLLAMTLMACTEGGGGPNLSSAEPMGSNVTPNTNTSSIPTTSVQKLTYKVGPFSLPAGQKAQTMWESPGSIDFKTEEPLWVTSFESSIEDDSGGELPANLLHLAVLTNGSEKNPFCTEKEIPNPFIAATAITKTIELSEWQGYPIVPNDPLNAKVVLQNPTTQDFSSVYFKFTITAVSMKAAKNFKDVMPLLLNVDPCDYLPIAVAPKEFVKKHISFIIPEDGLLTKAYGLLQDYGVGVALTAKDQITPFWEAKAELSQEHKILSLPSFEDPAGIPLKAGDKISLDVAYDNLADQWQNGAIGAVMTYLTRTDGEKTEKSSAPINAASAQKLLLK